MIKSFLKKNFKNFFFFYKRMGHRVFVMILLTFGVGIMDGMGLTMFLPLFQVAANSTKGTASEPASGGGDKVASLMELLHVPVTLQSILVIMVVFYIIKGVFQFIKIKYDTDTGRYFMLRTRKRLVAAFSQIQYKYFIKANVGRIQNIMTGELATVYNAFTQYISIIQQLIMVLVYMSFAVLMNAQFAIFITIGGLLFNFLFKKIYRITKQSSRQRVSAANMYQGLIIQLVNNFKYLKATGFLNKYSIKVNESVEAIEKENKRMGYLGAISGAIREPILITIVSVVILLQVYVLDGALGTIIVSLLFFYRALTAVTFLQVNLNNFNTMIGTLENVNWFEEELERHKEKNGGERHIVKFNRALELCDARFFYDEKLVLRDINICIPVNRTIAFVGESGSGKTTLVNIIAGLLPIETGSYLIDGEPIQNIRLSSFQQQIGYVSQEPVIFNDTIYNNVTFWAEETVENKQRFEAALQKAEMWEYISGLSEKENTLLGNNGVNLSGGQKQRISIARELFKKVQILIFDEATSALDSETEQAIQSNIDALHGQLTILIIAHRLSTIKNADDIVLMSQGRIIDQASFEILKEREPRFRRMVELQAM